MLTPANSAGPRCYGASNMETESVVGACALLLGAGKPWGDPSTNRLQSPGQDTNKPARMQKYCTMCGTLDENHA